MSNKSLVRTLIGAAALAATLPVAAQTALVLEDVSERDTNNPEDVQCIIFGNSCPGGFLDMASMNYAQTGSQSSFDVTSDPNQEGQNEASLISDYTVGYLESFIGRVFIVGIDVNTAAGQDPERLQRFEVNVNSGAGYVTRFLYTGPGSLAPEFNGNGYFDYTLSTIDLSSFAAGDLVQFRAVWDQATDGAENFFVSRQVVAIPEPSTYALMLAGLAAVGYMSRRRRQE